MSDPNNDGLYRATSTDPNALGLSNPDGVLSGTNRGTQNLGSKNIRSEPENTRIVVDDNTTNRVSFGRIGTGVNDWGLKVSKSGYNVDTATVDQLIFNSSQNVFKIAATQTVTIPALTQGANTSGSSGASIDLTAYPANAIILPIARVSGQPSFIWQGMQGLSATVAVGTAGWQVVADYSTSFTFTGIMQLSRTLINASAGSYTDTAYTVTIYVLQETAA